MIFLNLKNYHGHTLSPTKPLLENWISVFGKIYFKITQKTKWESIESVPAMPQLSKEKEPRLKRKDFKGFLAVRFNAKQNQKMDAVLVGSKESPESI